MTVEEELQGGIRNALERGIPLESIMKSFINAGYSESVVRTAVTAVTDGVPVKLNSTNQVAVVDAQPVKFSSSPPSQSSNVPARSIDAFTPPKIPTSPVGQIAPQTLQTQPPENSNKMKIYLLVGVLILLLILLGASILFREQLTSLFS